MRRSAEAPTFAMPAWYRWTCEAQAGAVHAGQLTIAEDEQLLAVRHAIAIRQAAAAEKRAARAPARRR